MSSEFGWLRAPAPAPVVLLDRRHKPLLEQRQQVSVDAFEFEEALEAVDTLLQALDSRSRAVAMARVGTADGVTCQYLEADTVRY